MSMEIQQDQEEFQAALNQLASSRNNSGQGAKLSAVSAALMETVLNQRKEHGGSKKSELLTPEEIFVAGLATLEGTVIQEQANESLLSTQLALMQILDMTLNFITSGALYSQQFPLLSRVLRAVHMTLEGISGGNVEGASTTARHLISLTKTSVASFYNTRLFDDVSSAPKSQQKPILKLIQDCILTYFDHSSPKIRKMAQLCAVELLSGTSGNSIVQDHVQQYVHAVLTTKATKSSTIFEAGSEQQLIRVFHMLNFVQQASGLLMCSSSSVKLDQDLIELLVDATTFIVASPTLQNATRTKVTQLLASNLTCLVAIIEYDPEEDDRQRSQKQMAALRRTQKEVSSRVLASLLQMSQSILSLFQKTGPEVHRSQDGESSSSSSCRVLYTRLIVSCSCALLYTDPSLPPSSFSKQDGQHRIIAQKLFPLALQTIVHCCVGSDMEVYHCAIEVQRMNRVCLSQIPASVILQSTCADSMKAFLTLKYRAHWSNVLQTYAHFVVQLSGLSYEDDGSNCSALVTSLIDRLEELHLTNSLSDPSSIPHIENAVGVIIEGVGIEQFLSLSPLDKGSIATGANDSDGLSHNRLWILNLLKTRGANHTHQQSVPPYHLSFFQSHVLALARKCDAATAGDKTGRADALNATIQKQACLDLWSLLVFFSACPADIQEHFPALVPILVRAIQDVRYPQLVTIIATSLKVLASGAKQRLEESKNLNDSEMLNAFQGDAKVISEMSVKLLPTFFKLVESLSSGGSAVSSTPNDQPSNKLSASEQQEKLQRSTSVTDAIAELARLAPPDFLHSLFKKVMHRLILATQQQQESTSNQDSVEAYLRLAQALVSSKSLDHSSIDLLYRAIKPLIRSDENFVKAQKQAYKVMAEICSSYASFTNSGEKLTETSELLVGSIMACHVSARHMRLKCLNNMIKEFDSDNEQHMDLMVQMTGEVLLCLKDSNRKTRELAYEILLSMARVFNDMNAFFPIILGALAAKTPHMRSAAVMALSRLVFEYARRDDSVQAMLPSLLTTVVVLFDEKSREVIKSVVGFVRVSVAAMSPEQLEAIIPEVVAGLFKFGRGKGRFRAKIKIILKKLVRLFGYEKITPHVPETDSRLLTYMRKLAERAARKKAEGRERADDNNGGDFENMMESDEEDSDDGLTITTGMTGFTRMTALSGKSVRSAATMRSTAQSEKSLAKSVQSGALSIGGKSTKSAKSRVDRGQDPRIVNIEKDGEVLDMLDSAGIMKSVRFADGANRNDSDSDDESDDGMMEFDSSGRLVVKDAALVMNKGGHEDMDMDDDVDGENEQIKHGAKRRRVSKFENAKEAKAVAHARKNEQHRRKHQQQRALGADYKAKKAGGDVKKKGQQFEPYAYIPLEGKNYTKKNRGKAVTQMESVVKKSGGKRKR